MLHYRAACCRVRSETGASLGRRRGRKSVRTAFNLSPHCTNTKIHKYAVQIHLEGGGEENMYVLLLIFLLIAQIHKYTNTLYRYTWQEAGRKICMY